jgi:threonine dehydrogenase-like Zn-dependent dehydrogenase
MNKAFVLRAIKDVAFEERAIPKLRDPYDVRVQIAQTGICGSDVVSTGSCWRLLIPPYFGTFS